MNSNSGLVLVSLYPHNDIWISAPMLVVKLYAFHVIFISAGSLK